MYRVIFSVITCPYWILYYYYRFYWPSLTCRSRSIFLLISTNLNKFATYLALNFIFLKTQLSSTTWIHLSSSRYIFKVSISFLTFSNSSPHEILFFYIEKSHFGHRSPSSGPVCPAYSGWGPRANYVVAAVSEEAFTVLKLYLRDWSDDIGISFGFTNHDSCYCRVNNMRQIWMLLLKWFFIGLFSTGINHPLTSWIGSTFYIDKSGEFPNISWHSLQK